MAYLWTKTAHLVFVMAWMGGVFYLPRILVNLAEAGDEPGGAGAPGADGRRLYRFGHIMFGLALRAGPGAVAATSRSAAAGCTPSWRWSR